MNIHQNNTPEFEKSLPSGHTILTWIDGFLRSLPRESRLRLGPAAGFVERASRALERAWCECPEREPKAFVVDYMDATAFKQLLDPDRPLDDPWVITQAIGLCAEVLRSRDRIYRHSYGDLVEVAAAEAMGCFSLIELGKRMWRGEEIENPRAYLRRIIEGDVSKLIEAGMRQAYPGTYAYRVIVRRHDKRLRQERLDLDKVERRALAATLAREEMVRGCRLLERVAESSIDSIADRQVSVPAQALSDGMVDAIDGLVADPHRFTDTDRDTWTRFKAAGFRGADINWGGTCSRRTGSQRLQALCGRLRRFLGDWA
jgi:hypothetical protein